MNGIYPAMREAEYFARPALSSTEARWLLDSPARYRWMKDHKQASMDAFNFGSAVHSKVLGTGWDVEIIDFDSYRTKAAQEAREAAYDAGRVPILAAQAAEVSAVTESVLANPTARALLEQDGIPEASVFATDPVTGVDMKARFDFLGDVAVDLKTTSGKASIDGFMRDAAKYRYDVQQGHYLETLGNIRDGLTPIRFIVVEKEPPYLVAVHELSEEFARIGFEAAKRARETYAECIASGAWPGYPEDVQTVPAPMWLIYQQEQYEEIEIA